MSAPIKIMMVIGTRPEAVKLAPVVLELRKFPENIISQICVTAQHRELLDQVLRLFDLHADFDLGVMREKQTPCQVAGRLFLSMEPLLQAEKPDWLLVQGDTTTAVAASMVAFYNRIAVAHVEAGLRTFNKRQPFPEEANRRVIGVIADLHFAPTEKASENLKREGINPERVVVTGNTVVDALLHISNMPPSETALELTSDLERLDSPRLILVTAHRRESFGKPLGEICMAIRVLAKLYGNRIRIVFPVHPNPNVRATVHSLLNGVSNINLLPPLSYDTMVHLMRRAYLILTDSGGIQEEAPTFGIPVLVLRKVTERFEGVEAGIARIVGVDREEIITAVRTLLENPQERERMRGLGNPYGDGAAAHRIVRSLLRSEAPLK